MLSGNTTGCLKLDQVCENAVIYSECASYSHLINFLLEKAQGCCGQLPGVHQSALSGSGLQEPRRTHTCADQRGLPLPFTEQNTVLQPVRQHRPSQRAPW